jgi:hypothetical protein
MLAVSARRCVEGAGSGDDEGRVVLVTSQDHVPSVPSGRCAGKEPTSSLPIAPHAATTPRAAPQATLQTPTLFVSSGCHEGKEREAVPPLAPSATAQKKATTQKRSSHYIYLF